MDQPPPCPVDARSPRSRSALRLAAGGACAAWLLLLAACSPPPAVRPPPPADVRLAPWPARVAYVQDGDSFVVTGSDGRRHTIRLAGIDAPERDQPFADASRDALRARLSGRTLTIHPVKQDAYGRTIARVAFAPDESANDVALAQLDSGFAWVFRRYLHELPSADRDRYDAAERAARSARRGLWSAPNPQAPWDFRQRSAARPTTPR